MKDVQLIALLDTPDSYNRFAPYAKSYLVEKESGQIIKDLGTYYATHSGATPVDWNAFAVWFRTQHPKLTPDQQLMYGSILDNVGKQIKDETIVDRFINLDAAAKLKKCVEDVINNTDPNALDKVPDILTEHAEATLRRDVLDHMVDMDLAHLLSKVVDGTGIMWGLESLNISVGQLHHSDFIMVGKRPDVGGTSFMIDQFTTFLPQMPPDANILIVNNEEGGDKLGTRVYQTALGATTMELAADPDCFKEEWDRYRGGRRIDIIDKPGISIKEIERIVNRGNYFIVGINVVEKLNGYNKLDDINRRQKLAEWCRNLAKKNGVVMGIMQADASAEGEPYMNQSQLYGSKTGVQGEVDVLLMIGMDNSPGAEDKRYISVCKNKKPVTGRMVASCKRLKFECYFNHETGQYSE